MVTRAPKAVPAFGVAFRLPRRPHAKHAEAVHEHDLDTRWLLTQCAKGTTPLPATSMPPQPGWGSGTMMLAAPESEISVR